MTVYVDKMDNIVLSYKKISNNCISCKNISYPNEMDADIFIY